MGGVHNWNLRVRHSAPLMRQRLAHQGNGYHSVSQSLACQSSHHNAKTYFTALLSHAIDNGIGGFLGLDKFENWMILVIDSTKKIDDTSKKP